MNKPIDPDAWLEALAARVEADGPQKLEVEGHDPLVVIPLNRFQEMQKRKPTMLEILRGMDWSDVDLTRDPRPAREADF
ncbi:MAG: hypothetical protein ACT6R7_12450 [Brevundimonas aurantiaca]|uniref:Antitoxin n=1 Tax=Brevundimonas aurantiaca TaxID=74316 RepID=A0A7W9C8U9_9CAUL|nr:MULTISPECIES: hypothetical protein [Brevundimonas]MEC7796252.1 hypothetical protein [Pseudomonadota bacterium]ALJ07203.1 hypothetical protein JL11_01750 [Brevundimonas sp. DS20]MBB5741110.1 hypothetical protein [Brevundimonas aurantiaca]MCC4295293.1 hypothetical protein [Brevundimonas aurantiaca]MED5538341.1 hypothetical protein [Pseudomonadota bacterium]